MHSIIHFNDLLHVNVKHMEHVQLEHILTMAATLVVVYLARALLRALVLHFTRNKTDTTELSFPFWEVCTVLFLFEPDWAYASCCGAFSFLALF